MRSLVRAISLSRIAEQEQEEEAAARKRVKVDTALMVGARSSPSSSSSTRETDDDDDDDRHVVRKRKQHHDAEDDNGNIVNHHDTLTSLSFKCSACGSAFASHWELTLHGVAHFSQRPFRCFECGDSFETKLLCDQHALVCGIEEVEVSRGGEEASRVCKACGETFETTEELGDHVTHAHGDNRCKICGVTFSHLAALMMHRFKHSEARNFECDACHKTFKMKCHLALHQGSYCRGSQDAGRREEVEEEEEEEAEEDVIPAKRRAREQSHRVKSVKQAILDKNRTMQNNNNSKSGKTSSTSTTTKTTTTAKPPTKGKFQCPRCEERCSTKQNLELHLLKHQAEAKEERPHKCDQCEAAFKNRNHLADHAVTVHSDERPFACSRCEGSFKLRRHLRAHFIRVHLVDTRRPADPARPFVCSICGVAYTKENFLVRHFRATHDGDFERKSPTKKQKKKKNKTVKVESTNSKSA